jgi:hypothetical protein
MMAQKAKHFVLMGVLSAAVWFTACGKESGGGGGGGSGKPKPVGEAFALAQKSTRVPSRFLMAVGYLESRLSPENAQATYLSIGKEDQSLTRGTVMTQTAFGKTFEDLGLDPLKEESALLETQIAAYSKWVQPQIEGLGLASDPKTDEEKYQWVMNLAQLQRKSLKQQRRNVQIIFARELIDILNNGFVWQDPRSGERIELKAEKKPLDVMNLSPDAQAWFDLTELDADFYIATYLPLITVPTGDFENKPKRIEVIHCPLSLSGCLELQSRMMDGDPALGEYVHLGAHYIIPPDNKLFTKVIQVADHNEPMIITDAEGENVPVDDAIVVMLAGHSGRNVLGERQPAIPTWFSSQQLGLMGQLADDICTLLARKDPENVAYETCKSTDTQKGVRFRHQGESEEYRWGDIPDFDPSIFDAYLRSPGGLGTEVAFEFSKGKRQFSAGKSIPLTILFNSTAKSVHLERLARCPDGKVVWEQVRNQQVRGERKITFKETYFDSGPNRNGDQFFRARVYGKDSLLIGWAIDQVFLNKFEPDIAWASEKDCE